MFAMKSLTYEMRGHTLTHATSLMRRQTQDILPLLSEKYDLDSMTPAPWTILLAGSVLLFWILLTSSVRYTLWDVVATLAMVESPTTYVVPVDSDASNEKAADADIEVLVIKETPVTSSIRSTLRLLTARAGRLSRWRGLHFAIVYAVLISWVQMILRGVLGRLFLFFRIGGQFYPYDSPAAYVLATILLARFQTTWTHVVISEPSSVKWWRYILPNKDTKKVWKPAALVAVAEQLTVFVPIFAFDRLRPDLATDISEIISKSLLIGSLGLVLAVGILIPSLVALVRVQASMLPEDMEAIVPFDRTFGGKVVPEVLGGSGVIGPFEAWRSFDRASRARFLKMLAKFTAIEVALNVTMGLVMIAATALVIAMATRE